MHIDPVFALRMTHFLQWLAGQGVTRMWTSGFLRNAMSPQDTHPMGLACDITGFTFSDGTILHLRSGLPNRGGGGARDEAPPRGHSDWFDHDDRMGDRTHAQIMMGIGFRLTAYFDRIVGPGHNPEHMNHFHVELSTGYVVADTFRHSYPDTPVVYMSGYSDHTITQNRLKSDNAHFIQKPFAKNDLLRVVRDSLDARR
jgi:hypothetical protein